jgi:hypothetical protein
MRRGTATLVTTIFLVILVAIAAGIHGTVQSSIQVTRLDQAVHDSQAAAESGLQVMKNYITDVRLPANVKDADVFSAFCAGLEQLASTVNLGGAVSSSGTLRELWFPRNGDWIRLYPGDNAAAFHAALFADSGELILRVTGWDGHTEGIRRTVYVSFREMSTSVFDAGIVSYGRIRFASNVNIRGTNTANDAYATIMSASTSLTPSIVIDKGSVSGDLYVANSVSQVQTRDVAVGGATGDAIAEHIHVAVPPDKHQFTPTIFRSFATTTYTSGMSGTVSNLSLPPNTNPLLDRLHTVNGIFYVDTPNNVTISNNFTVNGVIVFADRRDSGFDRLIIRNNFSVGPMPSGAAFDAVRLATAGYAILAPTVNIDMQNSGMAITSSIICNKFSANNNFNGTLNNGVLLTLSDDSDACEFKNNANISFSRTSAQQAPAQGFTGGRGERWFVLDPRDYIEGGGE